MLMCLSCNKVFANIYEGSIEFNIFEKYTDQYDGPHLYLGVTTENKYPCSNYGLEHSVIKEDKLIEVSVKGVSTRDLCLPAFGPASFKVPLDLIKGVYTLEFHSGERVDLYEIKVSERHVLIEPNKTTFSKANRREIERTPENLLWAECFYNADWKYNPKDNHCIKFFDDIGQISEPFLMAEKGRKYRNQFYLYSGEENELLKLIQKHDRNGFHISISTGKGEKFTCLYVSRECQKIVSFPPNLEIHYIEEPLSDLSKCDDVMCAMQVAFNTKNEEICEGLPKANQSQCFGQVGIAKLDQGLCARSGGTPQWECYRYLAVKKNIPEICNKITPSHKRKECFRKYDNRQMNN